MQPSGHVGGALVLLAIATWRLDEPVALGFTAVGLPASLLPDVDLLTTVVRHQGRVHTFAMMSLASVAVGLVAAGVYGFLTDSPDAASDDRSVTPQRAFVLATGAMLIGTFSHLVLDMISYPETFTGPPVEPFWPVTGWVPRINLFRPNTIVNSMLFWFGIGVWLAVYATKR